MADALSQNIGTAASLTTLLTTLFGGGGKAGGVTTQTESGGGQIQSNSSYEQSGGYGYEQTIMNDEGIKRLLQQIMEGTGGTAGLTQLAQGEKTAGLYNTTTRQQMIDDLMARASGEVGKITAKNEKVTPIATRTSQGSTVPNPVPRTVVTNTPDTRNQGILPSSMLGLLGLGLFGGPLLKKGYNSIEEMLFGSGSTSLSYGSLGNVFDDLPGEVYTSGTSIAENSLNALGYPELNISGDMSAAAGELVNPYSMTGDSLGGYTNYSAADAGFMQTGANGNMFTAQELSGLSDMVSTDVTASMLTNASTVNGIGQTVSSAASAADLATGSSGFVGDPGNAADIAANDWVDFGGTDTGMSVGTADPTSFWDGGGAGPLSYLDAAGRLVNGDVGGAATSAAFAYFDPTGGWLAGADALTGGNLVNGFVEDVLDDMLGIECFITTAVCGASGKADNCYELETLRKFRDTWLLSNKPEDIKIYYDEAPGIVKAITAKENATEIFKSFDSDYIQPAIAAIEIGEMDLAYKIYKDLFDTAKEIAQS